jgi:hypothetical protein
MKTRNLVLWAVAGIWASGCGSHSKNNGSAETASYDSVSSQSTAASQVAEKLDLRIVRASEPDPAVPDFNSPARATAAGLDGKSTHFEPDPNPEFILSGNQIDYERTLPLEIDQNKKSRSYFLVWGDEAFGTQAGVVYYRTEKRDAFNRSTKSDDNAIAVHDGVRKLWYIPLSKAIPDDSSEIDPSTEYTVIISFALSNGVTTEAHIKFRMIGTLPNFPKHVLNLDTERRTDFRATTRLLARGLLPVQSVILANPTGRSFRIWYRRPQPMTFQSLIRIERFFPIVESGAILSHWDEARLSAPVETRDLSVERVPYDPIEKIEFFHESNAAPAEHYDLTRKAFRFVQIGPHEKIRIQVLLSSNQPPCVLPGPEQKVLMVKFSNGILGPNRNVTEAWEISGWNLQGQTWGSMKIAESFLTESDVFEGEPQIASHSALIDDSHSSFVSEGKVQVSAGRSISPETAAYSCQGVPVI